MSNQAFRPANHPFNKEDCLYTQGQPIRSLSILVQGRLGFFISPPDESGTLPPCMPGGAYRLFEIDRNVFIGAADLVTDAISGCTCVGLEAGSVLQYPLATREDFWALARTQKDYGAFILQSLGLMLSQTRTALTALGRNAEALRVRTENLALYYWSLKAFSGFAHHPATPFFEAATEQLEALLQSGYTPSPRFDSTFMNTDHGTPDFEPLPETDENTIADATEYTIRLNSIPLETRKQFFGCDPRITARHIREAADAFNDMLSLCRDTLAQAERMLARLYRDTGDCLYHAFSAAALEMAAMGQDPKPALVGLDDVITTIGQVARTCDESYAHTIPIDLHYLSHKREQLLIGLRGEDGASGEETAQAARQALPEALQDSVATLLAYADLSETQADRLLTSLTAFRNLNDRFSADPDARAIRDGLIEPFRWLYEAVLRKSFTDDNPPRTATMLLRYGFVDEWLLAPTQSLTLYRMAGAPLEKTPDKTPTAPDAQVPSVWFLPDWLAQIHQKKAEPSRNTFDMDYQDTFRDLKRKGKLSDRDKTAYETDQSAKITFELDVHLQTNQKNCYGKAGIFCPVLHEGMMIRDPDLAEVTSERVKAAVSEILTIDPTAFHREVHFQDPRHVIEKERIHKAVAPDIILMPTFGSRGMMWQEISGRSRVTPGRLLLPAFTDEPLDALLVRLIGNFRWELCRTLMGTGWNDITQPSLTSEYADYIQFYKTNKDLSDEAKGRVKAQITKYRGSTRDMFTADYEIWIRNESRGNLRLNKVVRRILFKYCPFSREIRSHLEKHPAYADLIRSFEAHQAKEARSLESRYSTYRAKSGVLHPDLVENLRVFLEL